MLPGMFNMLDSMKKAASVPEGRKYFVLSGHN